MEIVLPLFECRQVDGKKNTWRSELRLATLSYEGGQYSIEWGKSVRPFRRSIRLAPSMGFLRLMFIPSWLLVAAAWS